LAPGGTKTFFQNFAVFCKIPSGKKQEKHFGTSFMKIDIRLRKKMQFQDLKLVDAKARWLVGTPFSSKRINRF